METVRWTVVENGDLVDYAVPRNIYDACAKTSRDLGAAFALAAFALLFCLMFLANLRDHYWLAHLFGWELGGILAESPYISLGITLGLGYLSMSVIPGRLHAYMLGRKIAHFKVRGKWPEIR